MTNMNLFINRISRDCSVKRKKVKGVCFNCNGLQHLLGGCIYKDLILHHTLNCSAYPSKVEHY